MMPNSNQCSDAIMGNVSGGGIEDKYDDLTYTQAGIKIGIQGVVHNGKYTFNGERITPDDADVLAAYYMKYKRPAKTLKEAKKAFRDIG